MTLARFTATKLTAAERQKLMGAVVEDFCALKGLKAIVIFGSAVTEEMSTASDIDAVLIFDTKENTELGRRIAPTIRQHATWPMDLLCVDADTFVQKSKIGGVYFVARNEGLVVYGRLP